MTALTFTLVCLWTTVRCTFTDLRCVVCVGVWWLTVAEWEVAWP